jgi:hypothetical protein
VTALEEKRTVARPMRKRTAAEKRSRRERKKTFMTIFINGKQKQVPRPPMIDGMPVVEFIMRNADPIWLHQTEMWELLTPWDRARVSTDSQSPPEASWRMEIRKGQDFEKL